MLIALGAVSQRLPWLVFSLPAGVVTNRCDRRLIMVTANAARAGLTALVLTYAAPKLTTARLDAARAAATATPDPIRS